MITVTQFSLVQLKTAQAILVKARATQAELAQSSTSPPAPHAEQAPANDAGTPADDVSSAQGPGAVQAEAEAGAPASAPAAPPASRDPVQRPTLEHLATELATELKLDEKKATYLAQILQVEKRRLELMRRVRVVQTEGAPADAVPIGDVAYIVDLAAGAPRPRRATDERDGRGGPRRGGRKGGRRGPKPGPEPGRGGTPGTRPGGNARPGGRPRPEGGTGPN